MDKPMILDCRFQSHYASGDHGFSCFRVVEIDLGRMSEEAERRGITHSAADLEALLAAALGIGDKP